MHGNYFFGPRGTLIVHRAGYQIRPVPARPARAGGPKPPPPIEARTRPFKEDYENDPDTTAHTRNFLDCVKSREQPIANIDVGFQSTLPTLLGLLAVRHGRTFKWDGKKAWPV